jgi:hypothetical protein
MKKNYILFTIFYLSFQILNAQDLEYTSSDGFLATTNKVHYNSADNSWVVAGVFYKNQINANNYIEGDTYLSKIDSVGNVIWKTIYDNNFPIANARDVDILTNNNIILLSGNQDCDVGIPDSLIQYSTDGVKLSKIESPVPFTYLIKAIDNNRFILASPSKILLIDNNWNTIWTHQLTNSSYNTSIHQIPNGNIFIFTNDQILNLDINTGIPYNSYSSNTQLVATQEGDFFYMVDEMESVTIMDTSFNFGFASFSIANDFDEVYKIRVVENNRIAIHGKKDGHTNIKLFDSGFTLIDSIDWEVEHLFINDFDFNHNRIAVAGSDFSTKYPTNYLPNYFLYYIDEGSAHSFLKTFDYDLNSSAIGIDVGVTEVSTNDYSTSFDSCGSSYYSHNFTVNDVSVTIKNYGTQTINHFKLFSRQTPNCPAFCPSAKFSTFYIDTVSLAPNASTTIHIDQIKAPLQYAGAFFDFCFWTGEANNQIDIDHSNDKYCLPLYSKTTHQQNIQYINIYPNPSSNRINLELPSNFEVIQFEIINATGQTIKTGSSKNIDISDLVAGFYVIKGISGEENIFIGKLIKE